MARDIKEILKNYDAEPPKLREGHSERFEAKLNIIFSEETEKEKSSSYQWLKIAAMVVVLLAVSFFGYQQLSKNNATITDNTDAVVKNTDETPENTDSPKLTLADISPDLKKVEDYYMAGINVQLASLKITDENKDLVDGYMQRLAELDKEYTALNAELSKVGPSEATVTALIENLKIRLDLLFKLKNKLKQLKKQDNEEFKVI